MDCPWWAASMACARHSAARGALVWVFLALSHVPRGAGVAARVGACRSRDAGLICSSSRGSRVRGCQDLVLWSEPGIARSFGSQDIIVRHCLDDAEAARSRRGTSISCKAPEATGSRSHGRGVGARRRGRGRDDSGVVRERRRRRRGARDAAPWVLGRGPGRRGRRARAAGWRGRSPSRRAIRSSTSTRRRARSLVFKRDSTVLAKVTRRRLYVTKSRWAGRS